MEAGGAGDHKGPLRNAQRLSQSIQFLCGRREDRFDKVSDVVHTLPGHTFFDQVVADALRVADQMVGVAVGFEIIVAAEPGDVYQTFAVRDMGQTRGAAHVGLHNGRGGLHCNFPDGEHAGQVVVAPH